MFLKGQSALDTKTQAIICATNVQHCCEPHHCMDSGFEFIQQEGHTTSITCPSIVHNQPGDLLLNTARMRDAIHMEKLRYPIHADSIQMEDAIMAGVTQEINVRKETVIGDAGGSGSGGSRGGRGLRGRGLRGSRSTRATGQTTRGAQGG